MGAPVVRTSSTDDPPTTETDVLTSAAPRGAPATAARAGAVATAVALAVSFLCL